jgi:NAD(P)-dependent dehydrogenase (short-subunit alcohol dehydrogenase family)
MRRDKMQKYLSKIFGLKDKVAVVIGGAGHLCSEMAYGLSKSGASVALLDKNEKGLKLVSRRIKKVKGKVISYTFDATKKEEHQKALKDILKDFKTVDILINGAGINAPTPFLKISIKEWHSILDSHITATFFGFHMSSASSGPPLSKAFTYSVAKSGIKNLTQNLAREWAPFNVRVNALRPGFFPTQWSMKHFITKQREKAILDHTAMGRYGKPKELIGAVLWLSCDSASFVTGTEIAVDGGFSCMTI